eukprot:COSAG01_NODE_1305_length_10807_cov_3.074897_3_plen_84_part_00
MGADLDEVRPAVKAAVDSPPDESPSEPSDSGGGGHGRARGRGRHGSDGAPSRYHRHAPPPQKPTAALSAADRGAGSIHPHSVW